ncbi:hypothetical protein KMW28_22930 [Flammeovirga yaeyamensis]|uniref:Lipoprotein n=1 Tax=Flammeovirga yaeyamensis TaxID=367791 RepID=A0AAX1NCI6_9BACT|nr:hypothetical protein [Flammeovirga yaeyamensis]MBB3696781.1 hypothetical protein [Flammeovirga yaeyamensis]NMF33447.1 hypothetical protein [Flammeovirga yaeyamensis]QWG05278.1 hypothetical protein KMW28_22930 [Flammeovirga yaeyamensis]
MRLFKSLSTIALASVCLFSCDSETLSEEFDEINGDVVEKTIKKMTLEELSSTGVSYEYEVMNFNYSDGKLKSITGVDDDLNVEYEGDDLDSFSAGGDVLNVEELFESPHDAFETGYVETYDENGNPKVIGFYEDEYDYELNQMVKILRFANVSYDDKPNLFYYTFASAGVIDVLDKVELNMGMNFQSTELIMARKLFPLNNVTKIEYTNEEGEAIGTLTIEYTYDEDGYPTFASGVNDIFDHDENEYYEVTFDYE